MMLAAEPQTVMATATVSASIVILLVLFERGDRTGVCGGMNRSDW